MGFLGGALSGYLNQASKGKDGKPKGLGLGKKLYDKFRKKKSDGGSAHETDSGVPEFKRGGRVRKTGLAKVHKDEQVLTKRQAKRYRGSKKR